MDILALLGAGCVEVLMVFSLKKTKGFKNLIWSFLTIIFAICSLGLLSYAMCFLESGVAYSIWVSFGSIGSLVIGEILYKEKLNFKQIICIIVIIISVICLKIFG